MILDNKKALCFIHNAYSALLPLENKKNECHSQPIISAMRSNSICENFPTFRRLEKLGWLIPICRPNSVTVIPAIAQADSIFCLIVISIPSSFNSYLIIYNP